MSQTTSFDQILDAIELLPIDQQSDVIEIMRRRLAERARKQILDDARAEHVAGKTKVVSVEKLMREIES